MLSFFQKIPDMECLQGDTLPKFTVGVTADSLTGCSMQVIISPKADPQRTVICKTCTPVSGGFEVTVTSEDTARLVEKTYVMQFRLIGADGLSRRKLCGILYVHAAAQGGD